MNKSKSNILIFSGLALSVLADSGCSEKSEPGSRPNIVIIMADDLGYSDISCYGGDIPTPNLDELAAHGLRFTQFYNCGRCAPTRASLLTGLYSHLAGIGNNNKHSIPDQPGYLGHLNDRCLTFAEVLKNSGYQTFMVGKYHVSTFNSKCPDSLLHPSSWPLQRGFDRFFGTFAGAGSYFSPVSLMQNDQFIDPPENFYYTNAINDTAAAYIKQADKDHPFLLYVAHVAPHWPLHALPQHIQMFENDYLNGWDSLRYKHYSRLVESDLIKSEWVLSPRDGAVPCWQETQNKEWEAYRMAVYAAQVYCMDQGIGRIIETLKQTGIYENTLILFLSDNGGSIASKSSDPHQRYGYFPRAGESPDIYPGGPETYAAYGRGWANLSNTPFRMFKKHTHEGGIATPLIAHWPDIIKEERIVYQVGHVIDVMPTLIELCGADYPAGSVGHKLHNLEGMSLAPVFHGNELPERGPIYWEHLGNKAVRDGNWKLVARKGEPWELYDMQNDRTELNDLAELYPDRVKEMNDMWENWAVRANVLLKE